MALKNILELIVEILSQTKTLVNQNYKKILFWYAVFIF